MVICRGTAGGAVGRMQKGPSRTEEKTRTGKKGKNCMSIKGGDQKEDAVEGVLLSFWQGRIQGHVCVLLSAVLGGRKSSGKESHISRSPLPQCCCPWVSSAMVSMACWMLQD